MKQLICCIGLLIGVTTITQAQSWQWGRRGGGSNGINPEHEKVIDMATDKNGNLYTLVQLGGGGDATISTSSTDSSLATRLYGGKDVALISYDCSGNLRWTKIFGSQYNDRAVGMGMDTLGHIYVALQTTDILHVDVDSVANAASVKYCSLIQYDTSGNFKWLRQPTPDSVNTANSYYYGFVNMSTLPNGDTYLLCGFLRTGLIAGSSGLVVNIPGYYMLKYNVSGVPKELIKLDMNQTDTGYFSYTNFNVTKSRKFLFTGIKSNGSSQTTYPIVGGQFVKHPIFLCCFSQTGTVLWRIEDKDTISGGINGRPLIDDTKGLIYVAGFVNGATGDTIQNHIIKNSNPMSYFIGLPFLAIFDTIGNLQSFKNGNSYDISSILTSLTFRSDGRLSAAGFGGTVLWDGFKFHGGNGGYQIFMPSFDANTGNLLSMDSLKGSIDATYSNTITADNKNNIYLGGELNYDINIGSQILVSNGGVTDFFIAKYGTNNCGLVPLKFISYAVVSKNEKVIENIWQTANEINVSFFNVQRSINGRDFENIGTVMAKNKSNNEYRFLDGLQNAAASLGEAFYRIESIDKDGMKNYSEIKSISINRFHHSISIYPNPAKNVINIQYPNAHQLIISNYLGKVVYSSQQNRGAYKINLQSFSKGLYILKLIDEYGKTIVEKFTKE